jgi:hypothetical protein
MHFRSGILIAIGGALLCPLGALRLQHRTRRSVDMTAPTTVRVMRPVIAGLKSTMSTTAASARLGTRTRSMKAASPMSMIRTEGQTKTMMARRSTSDRPLSLRRKGAP